MDTQAFLEDIEDDVDDEQEGLIKKKEKQQFKPEVLQP